MVQRSLVVQRSSVVRRSLFLAGVGALSIGTAATSASAGITADSVVSYNQGTPVNAQWDGGPAYNNTSAVLGLPDSTENVPAVTYTDPVFGSFNAPPDSSIITPFNAQYSVDRIVAISDGGSITVHLSSPLKIGSNAALGIFTAAGLKDATFAGGNFDPAANYTNPRSADIQISSDNLFTPGVNTQDLGDQSLNNPTNIYTDISGPYTSTPGSKPADFYQPFYKPFSSFDNQDFAGTLGVLNGSAGGNWFDLSQSNLTEVNYVRFTTTASESLVLDAVTGVSAVPEPAMLAPAMLAFASLLLHRRQRSSNPSNV